MVRIYDLRAASCGFEFQKKSMVVEARASDLNLLLCRLDDDEADEESPLLGA